MAQVFCTFIAFDQKSYFFLWLEFARDPGIVDAASHPPPPPLSNFAAAPSSAPPHDSVAIAAAAAAAAAAPVVVVAVVAGLALCGMVAALLRAKNAPSQQPEYELEDKTGLS